MGTIRNRNWFINKKDLIFFHKDVKINKFLKISEITVTILNIFHSKEDKTYYIGLKYGKKDGTPEQCKTGYQPGAQWQSTDA